MTIVNALQKVRKLVPDPKDAENVALVFDDDFYVSVFKSQDLNPDAPASSITDEDYNKIVLEAWYSIAGDLEKVRKMEEAGVISGEFPAEAHIRMLEFKHSRFKKEVYGEINLP